MRDKYNFITVEGNTGAGKTTLARMLAKEYGAKLILEEFADNPFLPKFYADRERYAFPTEMFFLMDRHEQLKNDLKSNKFSSGFNITDYLLDKSLLYAKANLPPEEASLFGRVFNSLYEKLPQPELIIYVHSSVPRLLQNIRKRGRDFEQVVEPNYLQIVEDIYLEHFKRNPQLKVLLMYTDELDFVHKPEDYELILDWVNRDYSEGINVLKP